MPDEWNSAEIRAMLRPEFLEEFGPVGVRIERHMGDPDDLAAQYDVHCPPDLDAEIREWVAARVAETPCAGRKKPRHRHPDPIPEETIKQLKWELAQRRAKPPRDPEFTQEKIATRLGLERFRVQQAEALEKAGWALLRSHPEFSANDGFVRWPSAREAAQLLASERAEN